MVPIVGTFSSSTSVQAKLVLSHRPMFFACWPVHIVPREGVHCGTVQYWFVRLTPAPTSRWIAGRSTPGGQIHVHVPLVHAQHEDVRAVAPGTHGIGSLRRAVGIHLNSGIGLARLSGYVRGFG